MCPVTALGIYLRRTPEVREQDKVLFVHYDPDKAARLISKATLSRWLTDVIRQAYIILRKDPPVRGNPHSVRGVATSWAEFPESILTRSVWPLLGLALH